MLETGCDWQVRLGDKGRSKMRLWMEGTELRLEENMV